MGGFLIILVIFVAVWLLFVLPARRRRVQHAAMQDHLEQGNEIITAGGLHGTVLELADDTVRVEIAPGIVVTVDRRAVAAVATEIEVEVAEASVAQVAQDPEETPESQGETRPGTSAEPR